MIDNKRKGTYSSSKAWKLMTNNTKREPFGVPGLKYIKQVNYEINLGREINCDRDSRPTSWGTVVEKRVFQILPMSYVYISEMRLFHPDFSRWSGAPDLIKNTTVGDCKCPYSLEVFCDKLKILQKACDTEDLTEYKDEYPEDYWQHISNAILLEKNGFPCDHFEAIIYCPYKSELEAIREMILAMDNNESFKWIYYASDNELPWIPDGGNYKNLNKFRFFVPESDKQALVERMKLAHEMIIEPKLIAA